MKMDAITRLMSPGEAAVKAVRAGADLVLDSPDPVAAFTALKAAVDGGQIDRSTIDASVRRVLAAKARLGLHRTRTRAARRRCRWPSAGVSTRRWPATISERSRSR